MKTQKVVCIIQARMGSTRLPGKVLLPLEGRPMLFQLLDRVLDAKTIDHVVVATTVQPRDEVIAAAVLDYGSAQVTTYRGSEEDVLDRYYQAAKELQADIVIRVTSDCPVIDPQIIDLLVQKVLDDTTLEYASNVLGKLTFPRGLDAQVIRFSTLEKIWQIATEPEDREHVTIYLRKHPEGFKTFALQSPIDYSEHRWTVDEPDDYRLMTLIYQRLYPTNPKFRLSDILRLMEQDHTLQTINAHVHQKLSHF